MLISEAYRQENAVLHGIDRDYGVRGYLWAEKVFELVGEHGFSSVLDYGCGKGMLAVALDGLDVRNYDPAVPEFSAKPQPADLVVCTDVLEHVEPEHLDEVLAHLNRLARQRILLSISCRPAMKMLPDGRNAHLSLHPPEWWKAKLEEYFELTFWNVSGKTACAEGIPLRSVDNIRNSVAVADAERNAQVRVNCTKCQNRLTEDATTRLMPENGRRAILVCGGPSLKQSWPSIALDSHDPNTDIISVSVGHKFLMDRGIVPYAHIDCDPRGHKRLQIGEPDRRIKYWLASCVHPSWLDMLDGYDVALWHAYNGVASVEGLKEIPTEHQQQMIVGGGSVGIRAMSVLHYIGYRDIEIHGMDCSHEGTESYATTHLGKVKPTIRVRCKGEWFDTSPIFILYARYFGKQLQLINGCKVSLRGRGLLQKMYGGQDA